MAIEDEIINISDIDIGTEILNSDKLLIETSNGTKMIAFKDFVIGTDNISFANRLNDENSVGESKTEYTEVTGFNILSDETTPGLNTKYDQISGTIELGKFNYNAIANLASVSADILTNASAITDLRAVLDNLAGVLESTNNDVLKSITLQTSACNCTATGATGGGIGNRASVSFTKADLDPSTTNPNCSVELSPFKLIFPDSTGKGYVDGSRFLVTGFVDVNTTEKKGANIQFFRKNSTDATELLFNKRIGTGAQSGLKTMQINFTEVVTINIGDEITATCDAKIAAGKIDIFKIS